MKGWERVKLPEEIILLAAQVKTPKLADPRKLLAIITFLSVWIATTS